MITLDSLKIIKPTIKKEKADSKMTVKVNKTVAVSILVMESL